MVSETVGGETFSAGACINRAVGCCYWYLVQIYFSFHAMRRGLAEDAEVVRHRRGGGDGGEED